MALLLRRTRRLGRALLGGEDHGIPTDYDVYDAAAWSSVIEASERSVANQGQPVQLPDFTRGKWKTNKPLDIVTV